MRKQAKQSILCEYENLKKKPPMKLLRCRIYKFNEWCLVCDRKKEYMIEINGLWKGKWSRNSNV